MRCQGLLTRRQIVSLEIELSGRRSILKFSEALLANMSGASSHARHLWPPQAGPLLCASASGSAACLILAGVPVRTHPKFGHGVPIQCYGKRLADAHTFSMPRHHQPADDHQSISDDDLQARLKSHMADLAPSCIPASTKRD